jgi:TrmH family RNA methyltransferase
MTETVTSLQNSAVKLATALQQKKRREESGLFVVEGVRLCEELLASGWEIKFGFFTESAKRQERAAQLIQAASGRCLMTQVSEAVLAKMAETEQPQGVLFVARQAVVPLEQLLSIENQLFVVVDGVQDPGNLGTLLRTADAAGANAVIVVAGSADPFSGKALRASMGSSFHLPLAVGISHADLLAAFGEAKIRVFATALEDATCYVAEDFRGSLAIVFGNEGKGVSAEVLAHAERKLFIPIYGQAESLNVGAAAAVILYEAARQRHA